MTTPDCPDGCAIREEATARADYILHTRTELDRVRAERDQLAEKVRRVEAVIAPWRPSDGAMPDGVADMTFCMAEMAIRAALSPITPDAAA